MAAENYSVEASVIENGKPVKGILTLFIDEYAFGSIRKTVDWRKVTCEKGIVTVKSFWRSSEKSYIAFEYEGERSPQFVLEQDQLNTVLNAVISYVDTQKAARVKREARERAEAEAAWKKEDRQCQIDEETRIREKARRRADEEYHLKRETEQRKQIETEQQVRDAQKRRMAEKQVRIKKEVDTMKNQSATDTVNVPVLSKKAGSLILNNPYRILGISCLATNEDANLALDKLKKLARLKALESYRSSYDLMGLDKPVRDLSVAQNALTMLKDKSNKWFWFAEADACVAWQSGKYRIELSKDGQEYGTYDLFLANYMYAIFCDPDFNTPETWKWVLNFYCFICKQNSCELLGSRFSEKELQNTSNSELLASFRNSIFKPVLLLCERDDLDAVLRLHKCIKDCDNHLLDGLDRKILGKLVSWFTDKESVLMKYLGEADEDTVSDEKGVEIRKHGEAYCRVVEPVLEMILRDLRGDTVRYDMIKESYRTATYQCMYVLNKCANKSDAIFFANKCYLYCKADDKKRIQNTFGEVNIKAIDWNTPHTVWDVKGDGYYYGRGCAVDYTKAVYWYHKAADAGNMYSMNSIAMCYQQGKGVPQNDEQAINWFEKAADAGNPEGAYNLAEAFFNGIGVRKDTDKALKYWAVAAKLGHPSAQQRRNDVFAKIQIERKKHRARNHICHDLGFQMTTGPSMVVEVTLNHSANVYLVNAQGYQNYLNGDEFSYHGGYTTQSPYQIEIPSSNHWYVIVDNGDDLITDIVSNAKIKRV